MYKPRRGLWIKESPVPGVWILLESWTHMRAISIIWYYIDHITNRIYIIICWLCGLSYGISVKYVLRIYLNLLINSFRLFWWINHCPSLFIWNGIFSFLEFWSRLHVYPTAVSILINSSLRCIMHDQISNLCSTLKNHPRII